MMKPWDAFQQLPAVIHEFRCILVLGLQRFGFKSLKKQIIRIERDTLLLIITNQENKGQFSEEVH